MITIKVLAAVCAVSGFVALFGVTTQIGYMAFGIYVITGAAALGLTRRVNKQQDKWDYE